MKRPEPPSTARNSSSLPIADIATRRVLTLQETAELFGLSVKVVRQSIRDGDIAAIKVGRKTFVLRDPLEEKLAGK
jgi:excisionase family DNA binding protein